MFEEDFMYGSFALAVVAVSLVRLLNGREYRTLSLLKNTWGRTQGLALHFLVHVGGPLVVGIFFFARGIAGVSETGEFSLFAPAHHRVSIEYLETIDFPMPLPSEVSANGEIVLLMASSSPEPPLFFRNSSSSLFPQPLNIP